MQSLEASVDKRSSMRKSMELSTSKTTESLPDSSEVTLVISSMSYFIVYIQLPGDAGKKVPPPTKAKPKPPAQEAVKIPVLPPNAAMASNLANVLKEGRKVSNVKVTCYIILCLSTAFTVLHYSKLLETRKVHPQ